MDLERKIAVDFLESLQKGFYFKKSSMLNFSDSDFQFFKQQLANWANDFDGMKEFEEELNEIRKVLPTKYENPMLYYMLVSLTKEVEKIIEENKIRFEQKLLFGTLGTGRVNGMAISIPSSSYYLILLEDGLFGFANLLCKAVALVFSIVSDNSDSIRFSLELDSCLKKIENSQRLVNRFQDVIFSYLVKGDPHFAEPYLPDKNFNGLISNLRDSMELFIVSHEYGHIIQGHLANSSLSRSTLDDTDVDEIIFNWKQEFEADIIGIQLLIAVMMKRGYDLTLSFWGADLFFGCVEVVEKSVSILKTGNIEVQLSGSHPPTALRRERLHEFIKSTFPEEQVNNCLKLSETVYQIIQRYWKLTEPVIRDAYNKGVKLAPGWY